MFSSPYISINLSPTGDRISSLFDRAATIYLAFPSNFSRVAPHPSPTTTCPPPHLPGCRSDAEQSRQLQPPAAAAATCCTLLLLTAASSGASFVQTWHPMTHCVHVHCVHVQCPHLLQQITLPLFRSHSSTSRNMSLTVPGTLSGSDDHLSTLLSGCLWCGDQVSSSPPHSSGPGSRQAARLLTTAPAGRPPRTEHCLYLQVAAPRPALATSAHRALWPL